MTVWLAFGQGKDYFESCREDAGTFTFYGCEPGTFCLVRLTSVVVAEIWLYEFVRSANG